jgi:hypothetical protein
MEQASGISRMPSQLSRDSETTPVNRPLAAFTSLMILLALAMFAVSSSSRSTTVRRGGIGKPQPIRSGPGRGGNVLLVLPLAAGDESDDAQTDDNLCEPDSIESFDDVAPSDDFDLLPSRRRASAATLAPVRVQLAPSTSSSWQSPLVPLDCLSHYDAVYDLAVYGVSDIQGLVPSGSGPPTAGNPAAWDNDWMAIFHGIVQPLIDPPARSSKDLRKSTPSVTWQTTVRSPAVAWASGFSGWLRLRTEQIAVLIGLIAEDGTNSAASIGWDEYAEGIDQVRERARLTASPTAISGKPGGVQSGDWLRHSAASSLHRLGWLMQAAGTAMDGPEIDSAGHP